MFGPIDGDDTGVLFYKNIWQGPIMNEDKHLPQLPGSTLVSIESLRHLGTCTRGLEMAAWKTCVNSLCSFHQVARCLLQPERKLRWKPRIRLLKSYSTTVSAGEVLERPGVKWNVSGRWKQGSPKVMQSVLPQSAISISSPSRPELEREDEIIEYFIPVTKTTLVRYLLEEPHLLNTNEKNKFEQLAAALDHVIRNRFEGVLDELKTLFDPLNPSKSVLSSRNLVLRDRLDREFWLLQKLANVLEKANFYEIPHHVIEAISRPHTSQGIALSIDTSRYAVLRLWALGQEVIYPPMPWYEETLRQVASRWYPQLKLPSPRRRRYLRRVIAAVRLKSDSTLQLKAFRDVPINRISLILPDGIMEPNKTDRTVLYALAWMTSLGALAQTVCYLSQVTVVWPLVTAFLSSLLLAQRWTAYHMKRQLFLADANRMHFFKSITSNADLLGALVDRALSESLKEALLVYGFLLAQRPPSAHARRSHQQSPNELGGVTRPVLEKTIEQWVRKTFGVQVLFDSHESTRLLESLGLISIQKQEEQEEQEIVVFRVVPLDAALARFPAASRRLAEERLDVVEGYDKDIQFDDILRQDNIIQKHGWD